MIVTVTEVAFMFVRGAELTLEESSFEKLAPRFLLKQTEANRRWKTHHISQKGAKE